MGDKYEVLHWDYYKGEYVSDGYTNSFLKAMYMVHKLERTWHCVTIQFRRDKVKSKGKFDINMNEMTDFTSTDFE